MKKISTFIHAHQQQLGITLFVGGLVAGIVVLAVALQSTASTSDFLGIIPAKPVLAYAEFPVELEPRLELLVDSALNVDWAKNIAPWADSRAALLFLQSDVPAEILPYALIRAQSFDKAQKFLQTYKNPKNELHNVTVNNITIYTTPALHFAFVDGIAVISPSPKALELFANGQAPLTEMLRDDPYIQTIQHAIDGPYFTFLRPQGIPPEILQALSQNIPHLSWAVLPYPAVGIAMTPSQAGWSGKTYGVTDGHAALAPETPYRALLLPSIPSDFDFMLAGQNAAANIAKLDTSLRGNPRAIQIESALEEIAKQLLPDTNVLREILPLVASEFALVSSKGNILLIAEELAPDAEAQTQKLFAEFTKNAKILAPRTRDVTLPDGTSAKELVPDPASVIPVTDEADGVAITGLHLGDAHELYQAFTQGKWFIATDLALLKEALSLESQPGPHFRESETYRTMLQPIMKNPELMGIVRSPLADFSFSKHTYADHMETNFLLVL